MTTEEKYNILMDKENHSDPMQDLDSIDQEIEALEGENTLLMQENQRLAPKADYTDAVLQSTSTFTFTQIAHSLGLRSVHALTKILKERGIIFHQSGQWQPTAKVAGKGYFQTRTAKYVKSATLGTILFFLLRCIVI